MEIALYIRKEYFRGVTLTDKSAHILEFHYEGEHVDLSLIHISEPTRH